MSTKLWDSLVITCSDNETALAFEKECAIRQSNFLIHPDTAVLTVVDPAPNIGSGGATINAIIHVTEYISAMEGYTVISSDVLRNKRILILHMGTTTPYSACSQGFLPVPATLTSQDEHGTHLESPATQFDILLHMTINKLATDSPPGFWVCSCDRLISVPTDTSVDWSDEENGVYLFTVPVELNVAANKHGVVKLNEKGEIEDIIYKGSAEIIKTCSLGNDKVPVISGVVFLRTTVVDSLLNVSVFHPLVLWTYLGVDSGTENHQERYLPSEEQGVYRTDSKNILLSLFFDVLLCMSSSVTKKEFVNGQRSGVYGTVHFPDLETVDVSLRNDARTVLWDALNDFCMKGVVLDDCSQFRYISHDPSLIHNLLWQYPQHESIISNSNVSIQFNRNVSVLNLEKNSNFLSIDSIVPNSQVGDSSIVLYSFINENINIGKNSLLINLCPGDFKDVASLRKRFCLPDNLVVESLYLNFDQTLESSTKSKRVLLMFGINDKFQTSRSIGESTIFNQSWPAFFQRTGILPEELWDTNIPKDKQCLLNAKLFPVYYPRNQMSIQPLLWLQGSVKDPNMMLLWRSAWRMSFKEILDLCSSSEEFAWRTKLHFEIGKRELEVALKKKMSICFVPFFNYCVKNGYFEEVMQVIDNVIKSSKDASVASRSFACIADVLGIKACHRGGLRSGPAANYLWRKGLDLLEDDQTEEAVDVMAEQRNKWTSRVDLLVRAARHYEGAFQILVRKAVSTARQFIKLTQKEYVPLKTWVTAKAPARLDLGGTWSDTPPICYENEGSVVTLSTTIDGKKPIGCRVKRIAEPKVVLVMGPTVIYCTQFTDFLDYSSPNSPGALLKAAFFCTNVLELSKKEENLTEYLMNKHQCGFVLETWSDLPKGSGLGTSSILAGCVISALWTVIGLEHEVTSVLHAVLDLEQMLTTGGGWQDQVGGLCPGVKVGTSANTLPLQIKTQPITMPDGFMEKVEKHLVVVFTGKTRLARNMLQDVLRNWNARFPSIVETGRGLIDNANETILALQTGNLELLGKCLDDCWRNKKKMAHGCEPLVCKEIMEKLRPLVLGISLAGAGGGGFMCVLTKKEMDVDAIRSEIETLKIPGKPTVHKVNIDRDGLVVTIDNQVNEDVY